MTIQYSKLTRIHAPSTSIKNNVFALEDTSLCKKLKNVLRMKISDHIRLFDGEEHEYLAQITILTKHHIEAQIVEEIEAQSSQNEKKLTLAQALTQSKKIDQILKMNTEIGVTDFTLFESDHSIVKLKDLKSTKTDRWDKILTDASRQSERVQIPKVLDLCKFVDLFKKNFDLILILHARNQKTVSMTSIREKINTSKNTLIVVGPEGGFSNSELDLAATYPNTQIIHANAPIMRTETAGVAVCSSILL